MLQVTGQGLHPILAGEYHDRFERVDGAWRFTERIFDPRLFGDLSGHMKRPTEQRTLDGGQDRSEQSRRSSCSAHPATSRPACCSRRCSRSSTASGSRTCGSSATRAKTGRRAVPREPARRDRPCTAPTYDQKYLDKFIDRIEFHGGDLSVESLRVLNDVLDGPAIFYLALPPGVFADAAETIAQGRARRRDQRLAPARDREAVRHRSRRRALALNEQLHKGWREDQIFRIDHFLGKETVQNILVFRFANRFIEPVLRADHVDEIQITVAETLGVEGRSRYYDGIGALRDMIQNHLIQMMTFATMEPPALWDAEMIRDHKVEVLKAVRARRSRRRRGARAVHGRTRRG